MIKITKKRKNPDTNKIKKFLLNFGNANQIQYLTSGCEGEIYIFFLNKKKYVIKHYKSPLLKNEIDYLKKLSDYKLIPEIFYIDNNYIISDYIEGKSLWEIYNSQSRKYLLDIINKVIKILDKWHKLGFNHGDINSRNIMVSENEKIYLIDPSLDPNVEDENNESIIEDLMYDLDL